MKVSELMTEIVKLAESKFGTTNHINDCVSLSVYFNGDVWQVNLLRPSNRQMASGEVDAHLFHTVKQYEYKTAFFVEGPTLRKALLNLRDEVENSMVWDWE